MRPANQERGAALLTVLLLVAVIAVLAGGMLEKLRLATRLSANATAGEQARAWAVGAEAMAIVRISSLLGQSRDRVTLAGGWSGRPLPLPLPGGGLAVARVTDGGNCFNLNSLVAETGPGTYSSYPIARAQFARLMRLLDIPGQTAEQIAAGASDWIDSDEGEQQGGAEDARYTGQRVGYRTAGTLMADVTELRAIAGVTPDLYAKLRPWLCTLPVALPSTINVNTLQPEQAPLLAMLAPENVSVAAAGQLIAKRPPQGWGDTNAIWAGSGTTGASGTAVKTTWFRLTIDVRMAGNEVEERALIDATRLPVRLVARQWGEDT